MSLLLDDPKRATWLSTVPRVTFGGIRDVGIIPVSLSNQDPKTLSEMEEAQIEDDYWKAFEDEARVDFI